MVKYFNKLYERNKDYINKPNLDTISKDSGLIQKDNTVEYDLTLSPIIIVSKITVNYPSRLRIYSTSTARIDDRNRDTETYPTESLPILMDALFVENDLTLPLQLGRVWVNLDTPQSSKFYVSIENRGDSDFDINLKMQLSTINQP